GKEIIGEHHAVADEHAILDGHAFADEAVAGNLAVASDNRILLNFNESADPAVRANHAIVKIDQVGLVHEHPLSQCDPLQHVAPFGLLPAFHWEKVSRARYRRNFSMEL